MTTPQANSASPATSTPATPPTANIPTGMPPAASPRGPVRRSIKKTVATLAAIATFLAPFVAYGLEKLYYLGVSNGKSESSERITDLKSERDSYNSKANLAEKQLKDALDRIKSQADALAAAKKENERLQAGLGAKSNRDFLIQRLNEVDTRLQTLTRNYQFTLRETKDTPPVDPGKTTQIANLQQEKQDLVRAISVCQ